MKEKVTLTLLLSPELYEKTKVVVQRKGTTFSGYVHEVLEEKLKEEERRILFDAFSLVAEDKEEIDVDYAFEAQREVVLKE